MKKRTCKTGATLADLAKEIGVPADALQTTLDTWNKAVADKMMRHLVAHQVWTML